MELFVSFCIIFQNLSRLELDSLLVAVLVHQVDEFLAAHGVDQTERAAQEWRETYTKDRPDVTVDWGSDDSILEAEGGLVHEPRRHPPLYVLFRQRTSDALEFILKHCQHLWVQFLL